MFTARRLALVAFAMSVSTAFAQGTPINRIFCVPPQGGPYVAVDCPVGVECRCPDNTVILVTPPTTLDGSTAVGTTSAS